ncbi:MAG: tetratricopeptide repeat protein [candidate division WOR-3 bacterium]|nr:tetratricopeptide repeat protein [candidate division WOR-3 bacterium]
MRHFAYRLSFVAATLLALPGCRQPAKTPEGVVRRYVSLAQCGTVRGYSDRYGILSIDSKKVASRDEYLEYYKPEPKADSSFTVIDSISTVPGDQTHPSYRRVRLVVHQRTDTLRTPQVWYYTTVNENGTWRITWVKSILSRADEFYDKGMYEEAIAQCDKALELDPYSALAYSKRAWCCDHKVDLARGDEKQGLVGLIESNARKALALEPENPDLYNTLALVFTQQDLPELRIECYRKAITLPYCPGWKKLTFYGNLVSCYLALERWTQAKACADSALAIDSTDAFALFVRGNVEFNQHRYKQARSFYDRAFQTDWSNRLDKENQFLLLVCAAYCEYMLRDYDVALTHILRALEINPGDGRAQEVYRLVKLKAK